MAQLSSIISTQDAQFRTAVTAVLRSSGTPVSIVEERGDGATTPDLAIVDARTGASALGGVERLRARWPSVAIVTIAGVAEPDLILRAMRAGANEFFPWPPDALEPPEKLVEGVREALRAVAVRMRANKTGGGQGGRTLSFFGAKGGSGTTTIAVNCASELARTAKRSTVIVDLNPFLREVALFLGVRPRFTVVDALDNLHRLQDEFLRELVSKHQSGLDILAGSDQLGRPGPADAQGIEELLQVLARTYDFVVIDGGTLTHACAELAVFAADTIFLVANPDVPSIRNTQRLVDRMRQMGAGDDRISLLLNRSSEQHVIAPQQIQQEVGVSVHHAFPSDYETVSAALNAGVPLSMSNHSALASEFTRFTQGLTGDAADRAVDDGARRASFLGIF